MRFIHALVDGEDREEIEALLDDENVDHVFTAAATDGDDFVVNFPLPAQAVDAVMGELRDAGLEESFLVIGNAEAARTPTSRTSKPGTSRARRRTTR
jgi:hypothetical protein